MTEREKLDFEITEKEFICDDFDFIYEKLKAACARIDELTERVEIIEDEHLKWQQLTSEILGSIKKQFGEIKNELRQAGF